MGTQGSLDRSRPLTNAIPSQALGCVADSQTALRKMMKRKKKTKAQEPEAVWEKDCTAVTWAIARPQARQVRVRASAASVAAETAEAGISSRVVW